MPKIHRNQIPTATLQNSLDNLEKAIEKSTKADGSVDVQKLENALKTADPGAKNALSAIADAFERERTHYTAGGCGSSQAHTYYEPPTSLAKKEVNSVLKALLVARSKVESFDTKLADGKPGQDAAISPEEAAAAAKLAGRGLGADLALATLQGAEEALLPSNANLRKQLAHVLGRAQAAVMATKGKDGTITMSTLEAAIDRLPGIDGKELSYAIASRVENRRPVYGTLTKLTKEEAEHVESVFAEAVQIVNDTDNLRADWVSDFSRSVGGLLGDVMRLAVKPHIRD